MDHFNLLMVLQTLVDFFEGYFLQQFYGDFLLNASVENPGIKWVLLLHMLCFSI